MGYRSRFSDRMPNRELSNDLYCCSWMSSPSWSCLCSEFVVVCTVGSPLGLEHATSPFDYSTSQSQGRLNVDLSVGCPLPAGNGTFPSTSTITLLGRSLASRRSLAFCRQAPYCIIFQGAEVYLRLLPLWIAVLMVLIFPHPRPRICFFAFSKNEG